jgi:aryl-alcohol dehydrogenase-like predicted oxidoreductase
VQEKIDGFRKALQTEQIDILLMHCVRNGNWPEQTKPVQDGFAEAKSKKVILAHGLSVHGLQPLAALPGNKWMDVALLRVNHKGVRMDTAELRESDALGDVPQVASQVRKIHAQGTGVLGMKLIGEGAFTDPADRDAAMKFAFENGVDAVTIGFKSTAEIDEAVERMNRVLNS